MNVVTLSVGVVMMAVAVVMSRAGRSAADPRHRSLYRLSAIMFVVAGAAFAISATIAD